MLSTPPTRSSIVVAAATTILSSMPAPKARPIEFRVMCRSPAKARAEMFTESLSGFCQRVDTSQRGRPRRYAREARSRIQMSVWPPRLERERIARGVLAVGRRFVRRSRQDGSQKVWKSSSDHCCIPRQAGATVRQEQRD